MGDPIERMRRDWDDRARSDAKYYVACQRRNQSDEDFDRGAADILARARRDYPHLPKAETGARRPYPYRTTKPLPVLYSTVLTFTIYTPPGIPASLRRLMVFALRVFWAASFPPRS